MWCPPPRNTAVWAPSRAYVTHGKARFSHRSMPRRAATARRSGCGTSTSSAASPGAVCRVPSYQVPSAVARRIPSYQVPSAAARLELPLVLLPCPGWIRRRGGATPTAGRCYAAAWRGGRRASPPPAGMICLVPGALPHRHHRPRLGATSPTCRPSTSRPRPSSPPVPSVPTTILVAPTPQPVLPPPAPIPVHPPALEARPATPEDAVRGRQSPARCQPPVSVTPCTAACCRSLHFSRRRRAEPRKR